MVLLLAVGKTAGAEVVAKAEEDRDFCIVSLILV
jgi:hypothetical protein